MRRFCLQNVYRIIFLCVSPLDVHRIENWNEMIQRLSLISMRMLLLHGIVNEHKKICLFDHGSRIKVNSFFYRLSFFGVSIWNFHHISIAIFAFKMKLFFSLSPGMLRTIVLINEFWYWFCITKKSRLKS